MREPHDRTPGFWVRGGAWAIDAALIVALEYLLARLLPGGPRDPHKTMQVLVPLVYNALAIGWWSRTLGKRAAGLRVAREDDDSELSMGAAWVRALASLLSGLFGGAGFLLGAFTPRARTLHDYACGSVVIYERPVSLGRRRALAALGVLVAVSPVALGVWLMLSDGPLR